jgi:uncharacterized iron-regulated protein
MEEEQKDKDWSCRKKALVEYGVYAGEKNQVPLREFDGSGDAASLAMGRSKTALVFHQLKLLAGEERFSRIAGLAAFEAASVKRSWEDLRGLFEKETGQDLGWFFKQWVDRKGLPDLRAENPSVRRSGSRFEVVFDLVQKGEVYTLDIPVVISLLRGGSKTELVKLDAEKKRVTLLVDEEPGALVIDGVYDVPRKLTDAEMPALLARVLHGERPVLVLPVSGTDVYAAFIAEGKLRGAEERTAESIKDADLGTSSFLAFGKDNPLVSRLFGTAGAGVAEFSLTARRNPWNADKVVVTVHAGSAGSAGEALRLLAECEDCSALSSDAGGAVSRKTGESKRGIGMELREEALAIDASALTPLSRVIEAAAGKKIVYVGEYHDRFAHHEVQLKVIEGLYRKNPGIAIGMEMFQRPFQQVLDDYIKGAIEEREFLKKSEYYRRWNFDYNLYKPILDFARAGKIPVVALNLRREITERVSREGMGGLTSDEKKEVPQETDFSDTEYRDRLKQAFDQHKGKNEKNFDFFYQAQVLWDETMAQSIDEYLRANPDRQMVVIAGLGHLAYGSGIPKRAHRRNGFDYATVLNDPDVDRDIGNYLVFPQTLEGMTAPRLMVALKESEGKVVITDLPGDSVSRKAGIKTGDVIVSLDGLSMQTSDDVKIALFYKKKGESARVKVVRKRFLLGDKEMEFEVMLP